MPNRVCSRGHKDKPVGGVCPTCKRIAEEELLIQVAEARATPFPATKIICVSTPGMDGHGATVHPGGEW